MRRETPNDPGLLGLKALAATLSDERRAQRLLATTGLEADDLRQRADSDEVLAALFAFLEAHEPDLVAVADAIGERPEVLVDAHRRLSL